MKNRLLAALAALVLSALSAHAATSPKPSKPSKPVVGVYVLNERSPGSVDAIKAGSVTHLLYAFLRLCGPGAVPADAAGCAGKADFDIAANPAHEEFHATFQRLKARMPEVKLLASAGGWGGSDPFYHLAASASGRAAFVASAQAWLRAHPAFDGLDIDWEHPGSNSAVNGVQLGSPQDGEHFVALMADLRAGLNRLGAETGRHYALSVAIATTRAQLVRMPMGRVAASLDLVFMMTYDFAGPWTPRAAHHTALRSAGPNDDTSLQAAVADLRAAGVPAAKLVAGVAMYGRGFDGVKADRSYSGVFPPPSGEPSYRELAQLARGQGLKQVFDPVTQSWALVGGARFIGYDDPRAVRAKLAFARQQGLAGVFAWELSQDNGEILKAMNGR